MRISKNGRINAPNPEEESNYPIFKHGGLGNISNLPHKRKRENRKGYREKPERHESSTLPVLGGQPTAGLPTGENFTINGAAPPRGRKSNLVKSSLENHPED